MSVSGTMAAGEYRTIAKEGVAVRGKVIGVNRITEIFIVKHEDGFSVVEPIGYLVEIGDEITGNLDYEGPEVLYNVTQEVLMESAIIQAVVPTFEAARRRI